MDILGLVREREDLIVKFRRDLHRIPELGLELPKTMEYISNVLDEFKVPYEKLLDGNAIVAKIDGCDSGKCLAIRADSDGLPIKEETGLEFSSTNENMHACGHDGHTAMALVSAIILNENRDKFKGTVKVFFQPGEEYPGGALPMIEEGCMGNPKVDAVIGLHEGKFFPVSQGHIGVKSGVLMASVDVFRIKVFGKGSHGAQPHLSIDPIPVACEIVSSLQKIVSRNLNPLDSAVVSVCQIHGGSAQNIIPDDVFIEGTVRTLDENVRELISNRIKDICQNIATANNCKVEVVYDFMYPVLKNDREFTEFFVDVAREILGNDAVEYIENPTMGAEDMAYFLQKAKGTFFMLTNPKLYDGDKYYPHHNSKFDIDESQMYKGTSLFVATALKFLG